MHVCVVRDNCVFILMHGFSLQEVAVKELLSASGKSLRKTTSVPNIHQVL